MAKYRLPYSNPKTNPISLELFKSYLKYDPLTGHFTWNRKTWKSGRPSWTYGRRAGGKTNTGYISISLKGRIAHAHLWAWFYMTGVWPDHEIDHRNRKRTDNRWKNLRKASRAENCWNAARKSNNTSGYKGVGFHKQTGKWRARVTRNKVTVNLGLFKTAVAASRAYKKMSAKMHKQFAAHNIPGADNFAVGRTQPTKKRG